MLEYMIKMITIIDEIEDKKQFILDLESIQERFIKNYKNEEPIVVYEEDRLILATAVELLSALLLN